MRSSIRSWHWCSVPLFLGEKITPSVALAVLLILAGVGLVLFQGQGAVIIIRPVCIIPGTPD